jgi:cell division transport system permease protein
MFTSFFRIIRFGWHEVSRNLGISIGTIFIMFTVLFLVGSVLLLNSTSQSLVKSLEEKVDVSVYFKTEAKEHAILDVEKRLQKFPQVQEVEYVSREMALKKFKDTHKNNPLLMESLKEIGSNPLPASLNIRAQDSASYASLANFLQKGEFKKLIDKISWKENQNVIEKLFSISSSIKKGGLTISIVLVFVALVVTFNTIRLGIFSKREEIETMKLIGATNWFVRSPFIVEGILIGLFAGLLSFLLFFALDSLLLPQSLGFFGEIGLLTFFEKNIFLLLLVQVGGGVFLGALSSSLAAQKYLKV